MVDTIKICSASKQEIRARVEFRFKIGTLNLLQIESDQITDSKLLFHGTWMLNQSDGRWIQKTNKTESSSSCNDSTTLHHKIGSQSFKIYILCDGVAATAFKILTKNKNTHVFQNKSFDF